MFRKTSRLLIRRDEYEENFSTLFGLLLVSGLDLIAMRTASSRRRSPAAAEEAAPAEEAPADTTPSCGYGTVVLNAYFETGFDLPFKLARNSPSSIRM
jgi:hypothetical protein